MTQMPAELVAALRDSRQRPAAPAAEVASSRIRRGDIRFAKGSPSETIDPRLVLVLSVDSRLEFADVLLVHTATEMSCDVDLVVTRRTSGAPYEVVVEPDLRGLVWTLQLGAAVGSLDDGAISALGNRTVLPDSGAEPDVPSGVQLAGPTDPRWGFKRDEGAALRALSRDCTEALLDEGTWMVDPGLLRPDLLGLAEDPMALVDELGHWANTRSLELSPADVETLQDLGALEIDTWATVNDLGLGLAMWDAIQVVVVKSATATRRPASEAGSRHLVTATHLQGRTVRREDVVHYIGQKELVTA